MNEFRCADSRSAQSLISSLAPLKRRRNIKKHTILPASCKLMCPKVYFHSARHQHLWKNISCFKAHHSRWLVNMLVFNLLVCTQVRTLRKENMGGGEKVNPRGRLVPLGAINSALSCTLPLDSPTSRECLDVASLKWQVALRTQCNKGKCNNFYID